VCGLCLQAPNFLRGASAIVWARDYSAEQETHCDCNKLQEVLQVNKSLEEGAAC